MKKKLIRDKTFNTFCTLVWDCSESEFLNFTNGITGMDPEPNDSAGKTVWHRKGSVVGTFIWVKRKNNMETLAHEILHLVKFWLKDYYKVDLNDDTEEVYTMLHSFYFHECAKILGLKKYIL